MKRLTRAGIMKIKQVFVARQVEMSDNSVLFELVTQDGERIASSTTEGAMLNMQIELNLALSDIADANQDIVINVAGG